MPLLPRLMPLLFNILKWKIRFDFEVNGFLLSDGSNLVSCDVEDGSEMMESKEERRIIDLFSGNLLMNPQNFRWNLIKVTSMLCHLHNFPSSVFLLLSRCCGT